MKNVFLEHFVSEDALDNLWNECIFVFDANILLNMYRYSDDTVKSFFNVFEKILDRVWIPHQVAHEFLLNRLGVISQQEKSYDIVKTNINSLQSDLKGSRKHPFINEKILRDLDNVLKKVEKELEKNKNQYVTKQNKDSIKEKVSEIFEGKVGAPYSKEELVKILDEGKKRFLEKIPPGYKDADKAKEEDLFNNKCKAFGDYIIWRQILDYAKKEKANIVLITDDAKEDWWQRFEGKTIGPRTELIKEFFAITGKNFYMYMSDRFLEYSQEKFHSSVEDKIFNEIRAMQKAPLRKKIGVVEREKRNRILLNEIEKSERRIEKLENEINRIHVSQLNEMNRKANINSAYSYHQLDRENTDFQRELDAKLQSLHHEIEAEAERNYILTRRLLGLKKGFKEDDQ